MSEQTEHPGTEESPTRSRSGADLVAEALKRANVRHLFGVQGGAIMPVYDAIYRDSAVSHVTMAHEQGAAHAADAYGIVSGSLGVYLATSGPGATNLVTGLADAAMDSDPVLALTGQAPSRFLGKDAFQEVDTAGITRPVTKQNQVATTPNEAGAATAKAALLAETGRPGPTLVDLPKDVTLSETDGGLPPADPPTDKTSSQFPDPGAVQEAARALADAEKPVILAGGGVVKADASAELRSFAIEQGIPVVTTMPAVGVFPEDHDLAMEMAGMHGTGYANMAVTHCDVMLAVGTRFDDRLTGGVETFAPDAEIIHVDVDRSEISKNIHADYPVVGDAKAVLEQFEQMLPRSPDANEWRETCQTWKSEYAMQYEAPADEPLKPQFIVEVVDAATPDDTIVTTGVGQHQMWAVQYWTYKQPRTWVSSHGLGAMGYGLPAAIGAKVGAPDQEVVCFDGDGSFLMTCQELAVAVRENLDITVFVLNNEAVGMVRQWQDAFFEGRRMASEYPWVPDFAALADAFGARGFTLREYDDVKETVQAALHHEGPSVVDCHIDPREDVYPMVPSGGDNGRFAMNSQQLEAIKD